MAVTLVGQKKLIITEIDSGKELILSGTSMPHSPTGLGEFNANIDLTYYPGNPAASVQLIGTEEGEDTLEGEWKDKRFLDTGKVLWDNYPIVRTEDLIETVYSIARRMSRLKVEWANVQRWGRIIQFKPMWKERAHALWSITFQWDSPFEEVDAPWLAWIDTVRSAIDVAVDYAKQGVQRYVGYLLETLELIDEAGEIQRDADNLLRIAEVLHRLPEELAEGVYQTVIEDSLTLAESAKRMYKATADTIVRMHAWNSDFYFRRSFGQTSRQGNTIVNPTLESGAFSSGAAGETRPGANQSEDAGLSLGDSRSAYGLKTQNVHPASSGGRDDNAPMGWHKPENTGVNIVPLESGVEARRILESDPAKYLLRERDRWQAIRSLRDASYRFANVEQALRRYSTDRKQVVHHVMKDEDLRDISVKYFGEQSKWIDIARQNGVSGSAPSPGTKLIVTL